MFPFARYPGIQVKRFKASCHECQNEADPNARICSICERYTCSKCITPDTHPISTICRLHQAKCLSCKTTYVSDNTAIHGSLLNVAVLQAKIIVYNLDHQPTPTCTQCFVVFETFRNFVSQHIPLLQDLRNIVIEYLGTFDVVQRLGFMEEAIVSRGISI